MLAGRKQCLLLQTSLLLLLTTASMASQRPRPQ